MLPYDKQLKALSQHLRKNMTDAEKTLWLRLNGRDMELLMIYKISPHPSLPKRGKEKENFAKKGREKTRNDPPSVKRRVIYKKEK